MTEELEQRVATLEAQLSEALEAAKHHGFQHRNEGEDAIPGYHQKKITAGAPTHEASEGTRCWVSPDSQGYINNDGSTGWTLLDTGGAGADKAAQYVVLALNADLTAERRLVAGTGLTAVDGGANGDVTLNLDSHEHDIVRDADSDTAWEAEKNADEDILRGKTAGTERLLIDGTAIDILTVPVQFTEIGTPSNPAVNSARLFLRDNGTNSELVLRSATGDECIICTIQNVAVVHTNMLVLNWIE